MSDPLKPESALKEVLVVDDIKTNRFLLVKMLKRIGIESIEVENGKEAVEACQAKTFAMVFMDIDMPVMDGIEATQSIRSLGGIWKDLPIIAITAGGVRATEEICLKAGMNAHYIKPIDKELITKIIETWSPFDLE
jgi:CheY-like chemotaxis protein